MSYEITMSEIYFETDCKSQKEIDDKLNKVLKLPEIVNNPELEDLLDPPKPKSHYATIANLSYKFKFDPHGNHIDVTPPGDEYFAKHRGIDLLAILISKMIKPGKRTSLKMEGGDEDVWGYAIEENMVYGIGYQEVVQGKKDILLHEWLRGKNE